MLRVNASKLAHFLPLLGAVILGFILFTVMLPDRFSPFPPDGSQVRKIYFADNISIAHRVLIDRFNEQHRGKIEVVPVNLPFEKFSTNERKELLARSLRNKSDRIDVFAVDLIWVPRFSKWSEPLDRWFPASKRNEFLVPSLQSCIYDSVLVAVPLYIDIGLMYYRRDILYRLPDAPQWEDKLRRSVTWDEMLVLRDRLGYKGKPFYLFQADAFEGLVCNYFELITSEQRSFFSRNTIDLKSAAAHDALQRMVNFVYDMQISPPGVSEFDEQRSYAYMLDHDAMFVRGWPNFIEDFRKRYPDTLKLNNVARAALPHLSGHEPVSVYGGWNLMISRNCSDKEAALEFVRFLHSEEAQKTLFTLGGYIPVNPRVYEDSAFMAAHADLQYYRELLAHGFHRPALMEYTKISDILSHFVHRAVKKELSVHEALEQAHSMIVSNKVLIK